MGISLTRAGWQMSLHLSCRQEWASCKTMRVNLINRNSRKYLCCRCSFFIGEKCADFHFSRPICPFGLNLPLKVVYCLFNPRAAFFNKIPAHTSEGTFHPTFKLQNYIFSLSLPHCVLTFYSRNFPRFNVCQPKLRDELTNPEAKHKCFHWFFLPSSNTTRGKTIFRVVFLLFLL